MQQHPHRVRARRRRLNRIIPALAVVGLAAMNSVAADVAVADEPTVTWSVSPADADGPDGRAWVELELDPGETATEHLAVRNLSAEEITFGLAAADGYFTDTGRFNMFSSDRESTDAGTWITVEDTVTVAPNGTAVLPFEVEVPENAPPGDHAAGVAASITSVSADPDGTRLGVESRVGFRVMTRVTGELQPKLDVVAVDAAYDTSWNPFEPGAIRIATRMANGGNVRLDVTTSALMGDRRAPDPSESGASRPVELLPGDDRVVAIELPDVWPLGFAKVRVELAPQAVGLDGSGRPAEPDVREVFVWTMPWPHLLIALAIALLAGGLLWGRRQRAREVKRLVREAQEEGRRSALASATGEGDG